MEISQKIEFEATKDELHLILEALKEFPNSIKHSITLKFSSQDQASQFRKKYLEISKNNQSKPSLSNLIQLQEEPSSDESEADINLSITQINELKVSCISSNNEEPKKETVLVLKFAQIATFFMDEFRTVALENNCELLKPNKIPKEPPKLILKGSSKGIQNAEFQINAIINQFLKSKYILDDVKYTRDEVHILNKENYIKSLRGKYRCIMRTVAPDFIQPSDKIGSSGTGFNKDDKYNEPIPLEIYCQDESNKNEMIKILKNVKLFTICYKKFIDTANPIKNSKNDDCEIEYELKKQYFELAIKKEIDKVIELGADFTYSLDQYNLFTKKVYCLILHGLNTEKIAKDVQNIINNVTSINISKKITGDSERLAVQIFQKEDLLEELKKKRVYLNAIINDDYVKITFITKSRNIEKVLDWLNKRSKNQLLSKGSIGIKIIFPNGGIPFDEYKMNNGLKEKSLKSYILVNKPKVGIINLEGNYEQLMEGINFIIKMKEINSLSEGNMLKNEIEQPNNSPNQYQLVGRNSYQSENRTAENDMHKKYQEIIYAETFMPMKNSNSYSNDFSSQNELYELDLTNSINIIDGIDKKLSTDIIKKLRLGNYHTFDNTRIQIVKNSVLWKRYKDKRDYALRNFMGSGKEIEAYYFYASPEDPSQLIEKGFTDQVILSKEAKNVYDNIYRSENGNVFFYCIVLESYCKSLSNEFLEVTDLDAVYPLYAIILDYKE